MLQLAQMDVIFIILFILSIGFFVFGISQFVGFGWAMFFTDLLFQAGPTTEYSSAQNSYKGEKNGKGKLLGAMMIFISVLIFFLVLPRL